MNSILHYVKWILVWTSTWSMLMSPLAMGQSARKVSRTQMQEAINNLGLNRQITLGEFYKKNKNLLPPRIQKQVEGFFISNKNIRMPVFEVVSAKNTTGEEIPNIRITAQNGELINIQWFGEKDRLMKFQNTMLSETDVINFDDMFFRILAGDEKYRKQTPHFNKKPESARAKPRYVPYPSVSRNEWRTMTPFQKANYVVTMRQLWQDAREVLKQKDIRDRGNKSKSKKTSQLPRKMEDYFSLLLKLNVNEVQAACDCSSFVEGVYTSACTRADQQVCLAARRPAQTPSPDATDVADDDSGLLGGPAGPASGEAPADPPRVRVSGARTGGSGEGRVTPVNVATGGSRSYFTGGSCIVAGYVSNYVSNACTPSTIDTAYNNERNSLYQSAHRICSAEGKIACNPYVYGTPGGRPTCVTPSRSDQEFQRASHWDGPCDTPSRLSTSAGSFGQDESRHSGRYANIISESERRSRFGGDQGENFRLTEEYLLGVLKFRGVVGQDATTIFNSTLSDQILAQIALDRDAFNNEIRTAVDACQAESSAQSERRHERNYWQACDQLHRRFLMVNELFTLKCSPNELDPATLKCRCNGGLVIPGASCTAAAPPAPTTSGDPTSADPSVSSSRDCESEYPGASGLNAECKCANGQPPRPTADSTSGSASFVCAPAPRAEPEEGGGGGFFGSIGRFLGRIAPYAIAGVAAYFLFRMLAPKKPALQPAPDRCADGRTPPCVQTCTPPLALQSNGTCACAACPPGQTANATTCICATPDSGTGGTNSYTCPDMSIVTGASESEALAKCPTYPCWNGQTYQNPMNCPPQDAGTTGTAPVPTGPGGATGR